MSFPVAPGWEPWYCLRRNYLKLKKGGCFSIRKLSSREQLWNIGLYKQLYKLLFNIIHWKETIAVLPVELLPGSSYSSHSFFTRCRTKTVRTAPLSSAIERKTPSYIVNLHKTGLKDTWTIVKHEWGITQKTYSLVCSLWHWISFCSKLQYCF